MLSFISNNNNNNNNMLWYQMYYICFMKSNKQQIIFDLRIELWNDRNFDFKRLLKIIGRSNFYETRSIDRESCAKINVRQECTG